ncbi:MAG: hypothetical protein RLN81_12965 [Balneolaceae bacterium]
MLKTDVENWRDLELTYHIISNLELDSSLKLKGITYPVFSIDEYRGSGFDEYIDTIEKRSNFSVDIQTANSILNTNLDSLYLTDYNYGTSDKVDSILFSGYLQIAYALAESKISFPIDSKIGGWCEYLRGDNSLSFLRCSIFGNTIVSLWEENITCYPLFVKQELIVHTKGSDFQFFREEKVIWLFFKWIQIQWIDGNGLGDDVPSWER